MKSATAVEEKNAETSTTVNVTATVRVRPAEDETLVGPKKVNTLWGTLIRDQARMCIPDLDVLVDYPLDFRYPAFARSKTGENYSSGFFPADPISLHTTKR